MSTTKLLDRTVAGTPVREWPRVAAETVAPRLMWRRHMGTTPRQAVQEIVHADMPSGEDWDGLVELITARVASPRTVASVVAGDERATLHVAEALAARMALWATWAGTAGAWGPEWRWYLHRDTVRVSRVLRALEATW